ncbi:MAG: hypothetical protein QOC71_585 [Thermoplasmata archaeon]|nr:hypothetical protein [Thermoplasmata archaeon]
MTGRAPGRAALTDRMTPKRRLALQGALSEATALRQDWKEAAQHHILRVEGQFKELQRRLRVKATGRQAKGLPSAKDAEHIRALVGRIRIKATKGRAKDLRHVEDALRQALDRLPSE